MEEPQEPAPPKRLLSRYDALLALLFVPLWLIPITYVGSTKQDITELPRMMKHQYRVACLFTHHTRTWSTYHVEIQTNGSDEWVEMPIEGIFDMTVFGYRTKLHRLCGKSFRGRHARARMKEITDYIKARRRLVRPDAPKLDAVRVSRVAHPMKALAAEVGEFKRRTLKEYLDLKRHRYIFGEQRWDGKPAKNVVWRSKRSQRIKRPIKKLRSTPPKGPKIRPDGIGDPRKMLQLRKKKEGE